MTEKTLLMRIVTPKRRLLLKEYKNFLMALKTHIGNDLVSCVDTYVLTGLLTAHL